MNDEAEDADRSDEAQALITQSRQTLHAMNCPCCGVDKLEPMGGGWIICTACDELWDADQAIDVLTKAIAALSPDEQVKRDRRLSIGRAG